MVNELLNNVWERYDAGKALMLRIGVVVAVLAVLWLVVFVAVFGITGWGSSTSLGQALAGGACLASLVLVVVLALTVVKAGKVNRSRKDWYFAPIEDERLNLDETMAMMRQFITERGYRFKEDHRRGTRFFSITYFDLEGMDFSMRLLWTKIGDSAPVVEIGVGPETALNGSRLSYLRGELSVMFARRYPTSEKEPPAV